MLNNIKFKNYLVLQGMMLLYSIGAIFAKAAAGQPFLSVGFIIFYGMLLLILLAYALLWQQVLKKIPLSTAYVNRGAVLVWGMLWGSLFFGEGVTVYKVAAAALVFTGTVLVVTGGE